MVAREVTQVLEMGQKTILFSLGQCSTLSIDDLGYGKSSSSNPLAHSANVILSDPLYAGARRNNCGFAETVFPSYQVLYLRLPYESDR